VNPRTLLKKIKKVIEKTPSFFAKLAKKFKKQAQDLSELHEKQVVLRLSNKRIPNFKQLRWAWKIFEDKEKKIIKQLFFSWIIVTIIFLAVFIYNRTSIYPAQGGIYTEGLLHTPQFLNPVLAFNNETDVDLNRLVFSGLFRLDKNLQLVPDLAESYEVSQDYKIFTIKLKDGLKWHDGEDLTIDDVIFTYRTIQNPQFNSPHYGKFQGVQINKIDDNTVQFILKEPFAPFLQNLAIGIIPKHIWQTIPPINSRLAEANIKPIGSGPYKFKKLLKDKSGALISYTFEKFSDYHLQTPYITTIQFKFYPDLPSAMDAIQKQNIDGLEFIPKNEIKNLTQIKDITFHTFSLPQYTAIFFNYNKNEQLKNINVRKALAHAINKKDLIAETLNNEAQVMDGPILPGSVGYNKNLTKYETDTEKAKSLLEKEGWKMPAEEDAEPFRQKDGQTLEITLTTVDVADNMDVAEKIRNYWQEIGVKVNLEIVPKKIIEQEIIAPRNYQALIFGEILGADPDPFPFWHSSKRQSPGVNLTNFADKRADSLLEKGRTTTDWEERNKIYQEFQDILIAELPAIFLYSPTYTYPVNKKVQGINQTSITTPADRFNDISNWYIKTKRGFKK